MGLTLNLEEYFYLTLKIASCFDLNLTFPTLYHVTMPTSKNIYIEPLVPQRETGVHPPIVDIFCKIEKATDLADESFIFFQAC